LTQTRESNIIVSVPHYSRHTLLLSCWDAGCLMPLPQTFCSLLLLPFYGHYTEQHALASTTSWELEDFVGAKFHCLHALADGKQCIRIREKMLE